MFFCENCGAKLPTDARFCENCGFPVPSAAQNGGQSETGKDIYLFSKKDWREKWSSFSQKNDITLGILLTNTAQCYEPDAFRKAMEKYIARKAEYGIFYFILDMADEAVCFGNGSSALPDVLEVLKKIYRVVTPEYLLIVGDRRAADSAKWKNGTCDSDEYVDSDLPYITLDTESPWNGQSYDFAHTVCVGRIPARAEYGFPEACAYFENTMRHSVTLRESICGFSLTAKTWESVSQKIHVDAIPNGVFYTSPPAVRSDFETNVSSVGGRSPNLLYFNLHGSREDEYWFGQDRASYPTAFSTACLKTIRNGYILGTEACYGAKPVIGGSESMLAAAMQHGCLAFLGSTQVAYGAAIGSGLYADVVVGEYIKQSACGATAGKAFRAGLVALSDSRMNDTAIKTMAEFALYGDPTATAIRTSPAPEKAMRRSAPRPYRVSMPDVRHAVRLRLTEVSSEITQRLQRMIEQQYAEFADIRPTYYEVGGVGGYQAIYRRPDKQGERILKVYFDRLGTVGEVCISK